MDNLPAHEVGGVRETIEAAGARLLFHPPYYYSSELNPIEQAFAQLNAARASTRRRPRRCDLGIVERMGDLRQAAKGRCGGA